MRPDQRLSRYLERVQRQHVRLEAERFHALNESEKAWLEAARRNRKKNA